MSRQAAAIDIANRVGATWIMAVWNRKENDARFLCVSDVSYYTITVFIHELPIFDQSSGLFTCS